MVTRGSQSLGVISDSEKGAVVMGAHVVSGDDSVDCCSLCTGIRSGNRTLSHSGEKSWWEVGADTGLGRSWKMTSLRTFTVPPRLRGPGTHMRYPLVSLAYPRKRPDSPQGANFVRELERIRMVHEVPKGRRCARFSLCPCQSLKGVCEVGKEE